MTALAHKPTAALRAELAWLRARYDCVQVSPAVYAVIKRLEADIAWAEHRRVSATGKPKPGQDTTVEDGRGASAILYAVRSARVLNFMTSDEAAKLGIAEDIRRMHIRITDGKANMGPIGKANWMRLELQNLPSGDQIVVASHWTPPDPFQGITTSHMQLARRLAETGEYRADSRSPQWFGYAIAPTLGITVSHGVKNDPKDLARINSIINKWLENKVIEAETRKVDGKPKAFIVAGNFRPEPQPQMTTYPDDEFTIQ